MSEHWVWISGGAAAVLMLAILVGGPVSCAVLSQQEATKRVAQICTGDLKNDAVRAAACIIATKDAKYAGQ